MYSIRASIVLTMALATILVSADEVSPQLQINGQLSIYMEFKLGREGTTRAQAVGLPPGLRISANGTIVGQPCKSGDFKATALLVDENNLTQLQQELLLSIKAATGEARAAAGKRATGDIIVASPLFAFPNPAQTGAAVDLSIVASDSAGGPLTYVWDFGDGYTLRSAGGNASHAFRAAGQYRVQLSIDNGVSSSLQSTTLAVTDQAQDPLPYKVSKVGTKFNPFDEMNVTGSFDFVHHRYSLGLVFAKAKTPKTKKSTTSQPAQDTIAKVPPIYDDSNATTLSIMVPPVVSSKGFGSASKVEVHLITDGVMSSTVLGTIGINKLSKGPKTVGVATISYLRAVQQILNSATPKIIGSPFVNASIVSQNNSNIQSVTTMLTSFKQVVAIKDKTGLGVLKSSDSLLASLLASGAKVSDAAFANACAAWLKAMQAAKTPDDAAVLAAETGFINAFLSSVGAREEGQGSLSTSTKFVVGMLGATAAVIGTLALVAGGLAAGSAIFTGAAIAGIVVGLTATAVAATSALAAMLGGQPELGTHLANETKEIAKDTAEDGIIEAPGLLAGLAAKFLNAGKHISELVKVALETAGAFTVADKNLVQALPAIQTGGGFTGAQIPSGSSYYFVLQGPAGHKISGTITGTDGYSVTYTGTTTVTSPVIPAGAPGVTDTLTAKDLTAGTSYTFSTFTF